MTVDTVPRMLELELTHACQLACQHCLTSSHPGASHGTMTREDWLRVVEQAAAVGTETIQLIGGEPTVSPHWIPVLEHALALGLHVQVYSNLYSVTPRMWEVFSRDGVTLATSYYSDVAAEHDQVTGKPGSHARTRAAIVEALRRGIRMQVGIVRVLESQRADQAEAEMLVLGVPESAVGIDRARAVGRANPTGLPTPVTELCGNCGDGRAAVLPDGTVAPCVLGRALSAGNVRDEHTTLAGILTGPAWQHHMRAIPRQTGRGCVPGDSNDCNPATTTACRPAYFAPPFPTIELTPATKD